MDLTPTIVPKSDQLNADDLIAGPKTVTIVEVTNGTADQPVNIITEEFGPKRPYKPAKSMRRVMVTAWGADTSEYPGRRMTLFRDQTVKWAGEEVGGIRISHLSDIPETLELHLTVTRGKRAPFIVRPLDAPERDWLAELELADDDADAVKALGVAAKRAGADDAVLSVLRDRYRELTEAAGVDR